MEPKTNRRPDLVLVAAALLAAFLNIFGIWKDQNANAYYTSAVISMLQSFHNFFFASFDPGGFVTIDKPPVTFWVQTASAYLFGVHGWSVILPQALAGVGSVLLIYFLVKPTFGRTAARLAGLIFACTPIAAAVARTNNVDSMLVCTLLLAAWMLFRGIRNRRWGWVIAAFSTIGLAFNMKMLEAYMVVPAFYVFYLLAAKANWKKKLGVLAGATAALLLISFSWPVIVDSIPADKRPYVGSSQTNSVLELAFGYNGISRLTGNRGRGGGMPQFGQSAFPREGRQSGTADAVSGGFGGGASAQSGDSANNSGGSSAPDGSSFGQRGGFRGSGFNGRPNFGQGGPGGSGFGRGGGMFGTGTPGPLRLFQQELSGQISWLLPFAVFGAIALLAGWRRRKPLTNKQQETLFWLAWLIPVAGFFSVAGFFHQYYLIMLAGPIAALSGAGWVEMRQAWRERAEWAAWLFPVGLLAATAFQLVILSDYTGEIGYGWLIGVGIAGVGSALALFLAAKKEQVTRIAAATGVLALLAAPLYWAATPLLYGDNAQSPEAGPKVASVARGPGGGFGDRAVRFNFRGGNGGAQTAFGGRGGTQAAGGSGRFGAGGFGGERGSVDPKLIQYLTAHNTGQKYLFATTNAMTAAPYIIDTGKAVMAMGGFSGSDPILTVDKLKALVQQGQVKFFLLGGFGGFGGPGRGGSSGVTEWIQANSTVIPQAEWSSSSTAEGRGSQPGTGFAGPGGGSMTLYELNLS